MNVVVVYESLFGNTRRVAEAVADGVRTVDPATDVTVLPVAEATPERTSAAQLVVVGGPTHMWRTTSQRSRRMGLQSVAKPKRAPATPVALEPGASGPGVREWLAAMAPEGGGRRAAAFDTRLPSRASGGAARSIARRLRHRGYTLVGTPTGFVVEDSTGPLSAGELDRARSWGAGLAPPAER